MLAKIEGADCEWTQHVPIAISVEVTQAQADAIAQQSVVSPRFSDVERTVLRFTEQVVNPAPTMMSSCRSVLLDPVFRRCLGSVPG